MATDQYKHYQATAVSQADPVKLVEMMYEGAIRFIRIAQRRVEARDMEGAHNGILRAYAIVAELMATLDFEQGGEISARLEQCYEYVLHLLKEANIHKDPELLAEALTMLQPLLDTWHEAFSGGGEAEDQRAETGAGSNGSASSGDGEASEDSATPAAKSGRPSFDITG